MNKFVIRLVTRRVELDWGTHGWLSNPPTTNNKQLTVIDVELLPGKGHDFHKHPDQEEVIVCVNGRVDQWVGEEKRKLNPDDAACINADEVQATFNEGGESAFGNAILGPCVGDTGYELVDVAHEAP